MVLFVISGIYTLLAVLHTPSESINCLPFCILSQNILPDYKFSSSLSLFRSEIRKRSDDDRVTTRLNCVVVFRGSCSDVLGRLVLRRARFARSMAEGGEDLVSRSRQRRQNHLASHVERRGSISHFSPYFAYLFNHIPISAIESTQFVFDFLPFPLKRFDSSGFAPQLISIAD